MITAILTPVVFAFSALFATQATRVVGSIHAIFLRSLLASALLAIGWLFFYVPFPSHFVFWVVMGGIVGNGMADIALFNAYRRLGPRVASLFMHCMAAPFAALVEWLWLGTRVSLPQFFGTTLVLLGLVTAVKPDSVEYTPQNKKDYVVAITIACLGAFFQACGAILTRKSYQVWQTSFDWHFLYGITTIRILSGFFIIGSFWLSVQIFTKLKHKKRHAHLLTRSHFIQAIPWSFMNVLAGQILGLFFFQTALRGLPSAVVLPIVATTPLFVMILYSIYQRQIPTLKVILGTLMAVSGVIVLTLYKANS